MPYTIRFEDEASANASAQQVVVTDQLDSDLDWNTFELTAIGFGDYLLAVPEHSTHFETTAPVSQNGQDFDVQIEAGIHAGTGEVHAHFQSIEPLTDLPPNVLTGFLPPEDGTGRGQGFVSYLIKPKAGLATGTEIRNIAQITFDYNPPVATNQVDPHNPGRGTDPAKEAHNTIDAGTPTSSVNPLTAVTDSPSVAVSWTGSDDPGGSGIASYDVFVSHNGGPFAFWQADKTETSATFDGEYGHTCAFHSVARDNVGHVEAVPGTPDT